MCGQLQTLAVLLLREKHPVHIAIKIPYVEFTHQKMHIFILKTHKNLH